MSMLRRAMFAAQFLVGDGDLYWSKVISLLHFDGDMTDEKNLSWELKPHPHNYRYSADEMFDREFSGYFNISHKTGLMDADFTVEFRCSPPDGGATPVGVLWDSRGAVSQSAHAQIGFEWTAGGIRLAWRDIVGGTTVILDFPVDSRTHHIALTREGGVLRVFIEGVLVYSNQSVIEDQIHIGFGGRSNYYSYNGYNLTNCYVDELRMTKGVARYTENFTPPTKPFPYYGVEGWHPSKFFEGGANGLWYRFADMDTLYQDTSMTVPVTVDNDPVGAIVDKSGNGVNGLQSISGERVSFKTSPNRINFDRVDDNIDINFGDAFSGTVYINTNVGLLSYEINVPSGVWQLPLDARYLHSNGFREIIAVARAANETDYNLVRQYMGAEVFAPVGIINTWFRARTDIVSFFDYSLDVSGATNFVTTWLGCSSLVNFPLLDVSSGAFFSAAWRYCSSLINFPANFFDNCLATDFADAFDNTNLSQASIDGILVSINSNLTSNGTFNQSGGNAPSAVGEAAILAMRARGWTVTVTGGF